MNISKMKKIILRNVEIADNSIKRVLGLMFRRKIEKPLVIILEKEGKLSSSIHSFFVFFNFDVLFLDSRKIVVDLREKVKPFNPLIVPKREARYIVELKEGEIKRRKIKIGDIISWNQTLDKG